MVSDDSQPQSFSASASSNHEQQQQQQQQSESASVPSQQSQEQPHSYSHLQHSQSVCDDDVAPPLLYSLPHLAEDGAAADADADADDDSPPTMPMSEIIGQLLRRSARLAGLSAAALVVAWTAVPLTGRLMGRVADVSNIGVTTSYHLLTNADKLDPSSSSSTTSSSSPSLWSPAAAFAAAKYSKKTLSEKLAQVPVFAVTNASGQPYLANMDGSGSQVGLIFFSHDDALKMLTDMQKNPGAADARVYIMGLDKAYEMVKARPTPSGIRSSSGEELTMVFRFFPDSRQVKAAEALSRGGGPKLRVRRGDSDSGGSGSVDGVPVFVAKGLTVRKGKENVVPLFLNKEDLDSAWAKLRSANKDLPQNAHVVVGNLLYIIQQMEKGETPELQHMGFFAPRASVEYVAREQAGPTGQAKMHQNPVAPQK